MGTGMGTVEAWAMTIGLLVSGLMLSPAEARYPERPVKIVVPYAAGGGADLLARVLAQELASRTKGQFVVENRTGGGTVVGNRAVIGAAPDGYTLLMTQTSLPISAAVVPNLGYDVRRDLTPIVNVALGPNGLFVHPSVAAADLKEFLAYASRIPASSATAPEVPPRFRICRRIAEGTCRHRSRSRAGARDGAGAHRSYFRSGPDL